MKIKIKQLININKTITSHTEHKKESLNSDSININRRTITAHFKSWNIIKKRSQPMSGKFQVLDWDMHQKWRGLTV